MKSSSSLPPLSPNALARKNAVRLAFFATLILSILKIAAAWFTGSVSVLSESIHSSFDLLSSVLAQLTVVRAIAPADKDHQFGHGKLETLSALFEGILLVVAGVFIVYEGISHLRYGHPVVAMPVAMGVMAISVVVNLLVYLQNKKVAKHEESIAIETNAYHFLTDLITSLALLGGLVVIHFTGWHWVDPVAAVFVALYIFWIAFEQIKKCLADLVDVALPAVEIKRVESVMENFRARYLDFHDLRTRRMGGKRHIEMHLTVCSELKVQTAHDLCDEIEAALVHEFGKAHAVIHIEPCRHHGLDCAVVCQFGEIKK